MKIQSLLALFTILSISLASAQIIPAFKRLDRDYDEKLSTEEAAKSTIVKRFFTKIDTDKDGSLSEDEFSEIKEIIRNNNRREFEEKEKRDRRDAARRDDNERRRNRNR